MVFLMRSQRFGHWPCPIARVADVLGDPWVPMILRECLYGVTRFDTFRKRLSIAPNILKTRLEHMVEEGLLERELYEERPPRHRYRLTAMGRDATTVLAAMLRFGDAWYFEEGREPIVLVDPQTGRALRPLVVDETTGERLDPARMRPDPGPGFPIEDAAWRESWFHPDDDAPERDEPR